MNEFGGCGGFGGRGWKERKKEGEEFVLACLIRRK